MRYTLRSSSSKNLVGPLEFKRSKIINLETIQEEIEEKIHINWFILFPFLILEIICLFSMFRHLDDNKDQYFKTLFYFTKVITSNIYIFIYNLFNIGISNINKIF
jgi:hypothetical protein